MSHNQWEKFGDEIRKTVQDAIENQNYDKLNEMISDKLNQAVDAVTNGVKSVKRKSEKREETKETPVIIQTKLPSKIGIIVMTIFGYGLGIAQFVGFFMTLLATFLVDASFGIGPRILTGMFSAVSGILMTTGFTLGVKGTKNIFRLERFKSYLAAAGQKEYCNISDLAEMVGKPMKAVVKDLEYMIKKRWFLQGHLDKQKTCLMVTDRMYDQYCQLEKRKAIEEQETKERVQREQKLKEEKIAAGKMLSPEVQKIIDQGDEYVRMIRKCNDDIPGEEISEKIYRIELLVEKIFDRVEQNPKSVSEIRKLMDYYLPTTVKLLEAYAEMDAQPVGGENILSAKKEIEATLDTLNAAYEKLLDSLFQKTAWDVSSDISVLNTMLAQEGLKEDGLKMK